MFAAAAALVGLAASALPAAASPAGAGSRHARHHDSAAFDWPELHQGTLLDGYAANSTISATNAGGLGVAWATDLYGAALDSPVVAYDATLGESLAYVGTEQGYFLAIDIDDGHIVW